MFARSLARASAEQERGMCLAGQGKQLIREAVCSATRTPNGRGRKAVFRDCSLSGFGLTYIQHCDYTSRGIKKIRAHGCKGLIQGNTVGGRLSFRPESLFFLAYAVELGRQG